LARAVLHQRTLDIGPTSALLAAPGATERLPDVVRGLAADPHVFLVTDPGLVRAGVAGIVRGRLDAAGIPCDVYDAVAANPTTSTVDAAIDALGERVAPGTVVLAVGGGSAMDTAKGVAMGVANGCRAADLDYRLELARPSLPVVAVPTTAGTGSESTAMCVLDILSMKVKTGISHWRLRPALAVVDPLLTMSLPPEVTAASGMDIVCHALESYTAKWYRDFDRKKPEERVTYCGSNPVSDLWCEKSMTLIARSFRTAVHKGQDDVDARSEMMMAATFAGMGFGNSGVHIPHANAYPIAGMVKDYRPAGYPQDEPMVPHGQSVSLTAPEAFRFSFDSAPERHLRAAELMDPRADKANDPREQLPSVLIQLMRDIGIPNGIGGVGYSESDVPDLVPGTMKQQRLLATCPRTPSEDDIADILTKSVENW
jgi:hydroxyacid-oxoacid transhydrogenase